MNEANSHVPQESTIEGAAYEVGKWLNERPNRPIDLRHVAMLVHYVKTHAEVQAEPAESLDAKRYRYLRKSKDLRVVICTGLNKSAEELDDAIDYYLQRQEALFEECTDSTLKKDLDNFWKTIEDGSIFEVSKETSDLADSIIRNNPGIASKF